MVNLTPAQAAALGLAPAQTSTTPTTQVGTVSVAPTRTGGTPPAGNPFTPSQTQAQGYRQQILPSGQLGQREYYSSSSGTYSANNVVEAGAQQQNTAQQQQAQAASQAAQTRQAVAITQNQDYLYAAGAVIQEGSKEQQFAYSAGLAYGAGTPITKEYSFAFSQLGMQNQSAAKPKSEIVGGVSRYGGGEVNFVSKAPQDAIMSRAGQVGGYSSYSQPIAIKMDAAGLYSPKEQYGARTDVVRGADVPIVKPNYAPMLAADRQAANAPGVIGGLSLASGGTIQIRQPEAKPTQTLSPVQQDVIDAAASFQRLPGISSLYQRSYEIEQDIQRNPNDVLGNVGRRSAQFMVIGLPTVSTSLLAASGVYRTILEKDSKAYSQGVPSSQKATGEFVSTLNPTSQKFDAATTGAFLVAPIFMMGGTGGRGIGKAELGDKYVEGGSYKGLYVGDQPLIGLKTEAGRSSVSIGTPKFTEATPRIFERAGEAKDVNVADVMNMAERRTYTGIMENYLKNTGKTEQLGRYQLAEKAGKQAYYVELPFEKSITTMKEVKGMSELPPQAQENVIGFIKSKKGQVESIYGSFNADLRGALGRKPGDIDIQLKQPFSGVEYAQGIVSAIERGGGKAKVVEQTVNIETSSGVIKAFDIHGKEPLAKTANEVGSGEGIGFGLSPKRAVKSDGLPFMASGEQTARIGSSTSTFLRRGEGGEVYLGASLDNTKRTFDFMAITEKAGKVSGNKDLIGFSEKFNKFLNPDEKAYLAEQGKAKVKLYQASESKGVSSSLGFSYAPLSPSVSGRVSASTSPSPSNTASQSASQKSQSGRSPVMQSFSISQIIPSGKGSIASFSPSSPSPSNPLSPSQSGSSSYPKSGSPFSPSTGSPSISSPPSPPSEKPPSMPPYGGMPSGFGDMGGFTSQKGGKPKGKYQPSFTAVMFNIRGKAGKSEATGFGLRPIVDGKAKKGKRGNSLW